MNNDIDRRLLLGGLAGLGGVAGLSALAAAAKAGPLNPPAGPVASTARPLGEVEPRTPISAATTPGDGSNDFVITAPGSYYLTANATASPGKSFLRILAPDVTVDLCGFRIAGSSGNPAGIGSGPGTHNVTVRNGSISGISGAGIAFDTASRGAALEHLRVASCGGLGATVGVAARVDSCTFVNNGAHGLAITTGSVVRGCTANNNGGTGIISGGGSCTIEACTCVSNADNGISTQAGCCITGCTANLNGIDGIDCIGNATVESCTCSSNTLNGVHMLNQGTVRNCVCSGNGNPDVGAGVRVANNSRAEGNHCASNFRGIYATGVDNLIIRNTCTNNSDANFHIAVNNRYGPVIDLTASGAAAVIGNAGPGTLTSSDANANYAL